MSHKLTGPVPAKTGIAICVLALAVACQPALAATLCVNPTGASSCQTTISAAVSAAAAGDTIQVAAGTYKEAVTINKTLSLIGAGSATTIIDATGLGNGIDIDGSAAAPASGVSGVVVSGLTVENANFQGIIVQNASFVTIWNNQVLNNNKSLDVSGMAAPSCPGLAAGLQAGEGFDCGEGVNLTGVDHSVVSNNVIQNNAGGILLSDDTGATHDNVIFGNLVADNAFDCGITLASHSMMGVYHNTITANQSLRNGLKEFGAGAGVGIFAAGPGNANYGNVVVNNILMGNGLPGVAMHNHASVPGAPPVVFNDNVIVGNIISQNGADTEDTATSGPAGINLASIATVTGTVVSQNVISQEAIAFAFTAPGQATATLNNFTAGIGIHNGGSGTVDGTENWWGCLGGPASVACASSSGSVAFAPWLTTPFSSAVLPAAPSAGGGGTTPPPTGITILVTGPGGVTSATNTFQTNSSQVALDASQSTSSNPGGLSYSWQPAPGSSVGIPGGNTAKPFVQLGKPGTYQVILTVTDSTGATASATITLQYI